MSEQAVTDVVYRCGKCPTHHDWDVMQVIFGSNGRIVNHFVIALAADGSILRNTDVVPDTWEIISDENDKRFYQSQFTSRDKRKADEASNAKTTAAAM
jgi:hypothetical protein